MHRDVIDLTGKQFGKLTVICDSGLRAQKKVVWLCRCECGNQHSVSGHLLRHGWSRSCGCLRVETNSTHGQAGKNGKRTKAYSAWARAKQRCTNPKRWNYCYWGGRGIQFLFASFEEFYREVGDPPTPQHQLDRIDNDGPYAIGNVRWATPLEQSAHKRPKTYGKYIRT